MQRLKNEEIVRNDWKNLLASGEFTSPFQTPEFFDLFNTIPGQRATVYGISQKEKLVCLGLVTLQKETGIKALFSQRAILYGGILIEKEHTNAFNELLDFIQEDLRNEVIYIEFRNYLDYSRFDPLLIKRWKTIPYLNCHIRLENRVMDDILKDLNYNRRRELNLSMKEGVTFQEAANEQEVEELYSQLKELYQNKVRLPLPAFTFFKLLWMSPLGRVFIVKHNHKIIGGSFCIYYPDSSIFTYYYSGLRNYHPKIFPTHIAIYAALDFGLRNNLKRLDLMGAGKPGEAYGVRKYKGAYGGEIFEQARYLYITKPILYRVGNFGLKLLQLLHLK